jgi:hypothetical protein
MHAVTFLPFQKRRANLHRIPDSVGNLFALANGALRDVPISPMYWPVRMVHVVIVVAGWQISPHRLGIHVQM